VTWYTRVAPNERSSAQSPIDKSDRIDGHTCPFFLFYLPVPGFDSSQSSGRDSAVTSDVAVTHFMSLLSFCQVHAIAVQQASKGDVTLIAVHIARILAGSMPDGITRHNLDYVVVVAVLINIITILLASHHYVTQWYNGL
jgi:hypothetical protein